VKGKKAGLHGVRWPDDKMTLGLNSPRYTAADMREAFVAGFEWNDEHVILTDAKVEALRRYPDKEEK